MILITVLRYQMDGNLLILIMEEVGNFNAFGLNDSHQMHCDSGIIFIKVMSRLMLLLPMHMICERIKTHVFHLILHRATKCYGYFYGVYFYGLWVIRTPLDF